MLKDRVSKRVSSRCGRGRLRGRLELGWGLRGRLCRTLILHRTAILSSDFRRSGLSKHPRRQVFQFESEA